MVLTTKISIKQILLPNNLSRSNTKFFQPIRLRQLDLGHCKVRYISNSIAVKRIFELISSDDKEFKLAVQICGFISFLICLINHMWWRRWQSREFTPEPEWSGWGSWRPKWLQRSKCEEKENNWWGFFRPRGKLFKWEGYKKIKIKGEVIEGA